MSQHTRVINLKVVAEALRFRWKVIAVMALLVPIVALTARAIIKPKVKMSVQILVQESVKVNPFLKDMMVEWSVKSRLPHITSIVRSRTTLERVLRELGEIHNGMSSDQVEALIGDFRSRTDVYGEGGGLIRISVVGRDSQRVFDGLNLLTDSVVEEMLRPQKEALDESVQFLKVQLDRISTELRTLEEQVKEFKKNNAGELPEVHKLNLDAHLQLTNSVMETETALVAAQQRRKMAQQRLLRYDPETKKLREKKEAAQKKVDRLRKTYTDAHAAVRGAKRQVEKYETLLKARENRNIKLDVDALRESAPEPSVGMQTKTVDGTSSTDIVIRADDVMTSDLMQFQQASSEVESLRHKLVLLKTRMTSSLESVRSFASNEQTLNRLVRDLNAKSKVYTNLLERYEDALVTRELTRHDESKQVWIVETPAGPVAAKPISLILVLIGAPIIGLILGLFVALGLEFLDGSIREESEAVDLAGAPLVGTLPWLGDSTL